MSRTKGSANKPKEKNIEQSIEKSVEITVESVKETEKPIEKVQGKPLSSIEERVKTKAEQMAEYLNRQPRVMFMIPKQPNEPANATDQVCINGYKVVYPKGEMIEVPEQVAQLFAEKYKIQGSIVSKSLASGRTISGQEVGERL